MRVCEFARAHISCPSGKKILVDGAVYGRQSRTVCQYKGKQRVDSKHRKNTRCNLGSQGQWSGVARRGLGGGGQLLPGAVQKWTQNSIVKI